MAGNDLAFEDFMAARWSPLFRTAYLLTGDHHQAEELLQSALAKVCVRWDKIRDKGAADAYTRRTMLHLAQRHWKQRGRTVSSDLAPEPSHDHLGMRADHLALWEEIRKLPDRMRATLVLRYFEDLSVEATAQELGCSTGAVKSQTHHALRRLRAALPSFDLSEELS